MWPTLRLLWGPKQLETSQAQVEERWLVSLDTKPSPSAPSSFILMSAAAAQTQWRLLRAHISSPDLTRHHRDLAQGAARGPGSDERGTQCSGFTVAECTWASNVVSGSYTFV
ncbi:hypothetical protein NDU88_003986 [Pleurodeles waltl]|uniref:Uncharacterized protein n=1 Tax=Pleurodeles waltl TaxID=8319 RepID=A0AAV7WWV1_PLEWA|nr:hypothetical protein NDU88_003986 [Pleurodeles waltl]